MPRLWLLAVVTFVQPVWLAAQTASPPSAAAQTPPLLTRFGCRVQIAPYVSGDRRFRWSADFGADVDFWDYGHGRLTGLANYEVILNRFLDPSQGNYIIEFSSSARLNDAIEGAVFVHHLSRHLSDQPNRAKVSWNVVGLRAMRRREIGRSRLDTRVEAGWMTISRSFVDYRWKTEGTMRWIYAAHPKWLPVAEGRVTFMGVHRDEAQRRTQLGARVETGVRLPGRAADLELFLAYERRIDPFPTERGIGKFGLVGARLLSR